jgi:hypothetical protein
MLLSTILVLASCSGPKVDDLNMVEFKNGNDGKATFNNLSYHMIRLIATFMEPEDIVNWRYVNCVTLSSLSLKKLVEQLFNISGLESISDNEPELAGVMALAHTSHDHMLFFTALMEDIVWGKKPYVFLFSPLMLHLLRTFRELGAREKQEYRHYFKRKFKNNVECYMINACLEKGHFDIVLEIVKDNAYLSMEALERAARLGHIMIVEILLQNRNRDDIPAHSVNHFLLDAATGGHGAIVELLLQYGTDIPADCVGEALENAFVNGYIPVVKILLHSRTDIPSRYVGWALCNAATGGHGAIVELLLQYGTDIPADYVGWALRRAVENGHNSIVGLLLWSDIDISADHVGRAHRRATEAGHTCFFCLIS